MKLFRLAADSPWMMAEDGVRAILEVAARENLLTDDIIAAIEESRSAPASMLAPVAGRPLDGARNAAVRDGVAVLPIVGPIFRYSDRFTEICASATTEGIARDLKVALDSDSVRAVVLEIDSPGGQAAGIGELAAMIAAGTERKPIVARASSDALSAAYYLASAASEVVADPAAMLGSIGVLLGVRNPASESARDIKFISGQSPRKRPDPTTEKGREQWQKLADDLAAVFVADVARYRGVSQDTVLKDFGAGGVLVGKDAVAAGLADRLGSLESVISELSAGKMPTRRKRPPNRHMASVSSPKRSTAMSWRENVLKVLFGDEGTDEPAAEETHKPSPTTALRKSVDSATKPVIVESSRADAEEDPQVKTLKEQVKALQATGIASSAAAFADGLIRVEHKALPVERASLEALYTAAASDDLAHGGKVAFYAADDKGVLQRKEGSRVEALAASLASRPSHSLFSEVVGGGPTFDLPNKAAQDEGKAAYDAASDWARKRNGHAPASK